MSPQVTLKEVAARAGVSYQTVSKVLNKQVKASPETEQRIMQAVQDLGYRPNQIARNMRVGRSHMIGFSWVSSSPERPNHIQDQFLTSMIEEAEKVGYHLLPFPFRGGDDIEGYRKLIDTGLVDGFVLASVDFNDPRIMFLLERGFPFVAFGHSNPELDFPYVDVDGTDGTCQEVEHLILRGHRAIAVLAWPESSRVGSDRLKGYYKAMQSAGLEINPEWVNRRGDSTFEAGYPITLELLRLPKAFRPTAIVALNDQQAIGAISAAQSVGLQVGKDISIVGFDDAPMAQYLQPPLTTIRQPIRLAGRKCVELLVNLVRGIQLEERHILLKPELILRASA